MLAVFAAFPFERGHLRRTLGTGALALMAAVALTVVYHLGYRDFRGSKIIAPMRGAARRDLSALPGLGGGGVRSPAGR